jgi:transcription-repair coupling factor (superfamily II helicase)
MVLAFHRNRFPDPGALVAWVAAQKGAVKVRPDQKLAMVREMDAAQRLKEAKRIVAALAGLVARAKAA